MEIIRDVLYVKSVEKLLRRRLTEDEMDGQPFMAVLPNGNYATFCVPLLNFPWDVIDSRSLIDGPSNKLYKDSETDQWKMKKKKREYLNIWDHQVDEYLESQNEEV